jgi:hypothetical protein
MTIFCLSAAYLLSTQGLIYGLLPTCCQLAAYQHLRAPTYAYLLSPLSTYCLPVRDTTASYEGIDGGKMHVVEHHDDLFSWKKHNHYLHLSTYRHKDSLNLAANNL